MLRAGVEPDDLRRGEAEPSGDLLEIGTVHAAVGAWQLHAPAGRRPGVRQAFHQIQKSRAQRAPRKHERIVVHEERAEGGHRVDEPR